MAKKKPEEKAETFEFEKKEKAAHAAFSPVQLRSHTPRFR